MADDDIREAHRAIRTAHGAGRAEYLFDRQLALVQDHRDGIGLGVANPWHYAWDDENEGRVVLYRGKPYRVIPDPILKGAKAKDGSPIIGYFIAPQTLDLPPVVPLAIDGRDDETDIELRARFMRYWT